MAATKVTLKLLIHQPENQVLFAEAGKDFVDFLFSLQSLPLGTVTKLLSAKKMAGCLGNLYESIENLDASYMQSNQSKYPLLNPTIPVSGSQAPLLLPKSACSSSSLTTTRHLYKCQNRTSYYSSYTNCPIYVTEDPNSLCPDCKGPMIGKASYVGAPKGSSLSSTSVVCDGYVKGVVTYMVMDDLVVKPMSTISSIALLNQFNVKDLGSLQEKVVELGIEEGLELLSASMKSKTVLTDVFISKR